MVELFEHTADIGLRIGAESFEQLCAEAARGLSALLVGDIETVRPQEREQLTIEGEQDDYLLFDWLSELVYRFSAEGRVFCRFALARSEEGLSATIEGESFSPERHGTGREVKAITYHGLRVEEQGGRWVAEVIVDV